MKYLIRSVKYFFSLLILLSAMLFILACAGIIGRDISTMFVNGYDSLWQIAAIMAVFALIYPRLGFSSRELPAPGSYSELRPVVVKVMDDFGYRLEKEDGENLAFVKRVPFSRLLKMWEDRITFTRTMTGFTVEGYTKDVVRLTSAIEYRVSGDER